MNQYNFPAACAEKGVALFQSGETLRALPYIAAAERLGDSDYAAAMTDAITAALFQKRAASEAAQQQDDVQLYDDCLRYFSAASLSQISESEAAWRSRRRYEDGERALIKGDQELAAAHYLAASALTPGWSETQNAAARLARALSEAAPSPEAQNQSETEAFALAIAVLLDANPHYSVRLAEALYAVSDFETVIRLVEGAAAESMNPGQSYRAEMLTIKSRLRMKGVSEEEAERRSAEKISRTLMQYGPSSGLTDEMLFVRVEYNFKLEKLNAIRADLAEIIKRKKSRPENLLAAASNILITSHNALNAEFRAAIRILEDQEFPTLNSLLQTMFMAWAGGDMEATLRLVARATEQVPSFSIVQPLYEMATDFSLQPVKVLGAARPGPYKIYANVCCWGDDHIRLMERAMLASLLSPGNFPALARAAEIYFELFTLPSSIERLANSPYLRRMAEHCEVRLYAYPSAVEPFLQHNSYRILGFGEHSTLLRAERDGADFLQLYPDLIFGDGSYAAVAQRLTRAPLALLSDYLNAYEEPVMARLAACIDGEVLNASTPQLLGAISGNLTRRSTDQIYQPEASQGPASPVRTIFKLSDGLAMHSFFINPVYVSHAGLRPLLMKNFTVTDDMFTEHLLQNGRHGQVEMFINPDYTGVELCKDDGAIVPPVELPLLRRIKSMFTEQGTVVTRKQLFPSRKLFPNVTADVGPQVSVETADAVVAEILEFFETDQALSDLQSGRTEIERIYAEAHEALKIASPTTLSTAD